MSQFLCEYFFTFLCCLVAPSVTVPASTTYSQGENVTLNCDVMGGPNNIIQWQFRGVALPGETSSMLTRQNVTAADGGAYTCMASNTAGMDIAVGLVFIAPYFITQPQDVGAMDGAMVTLTCEAEGFPPPTYQWSGMNAIRAGVLGQTSTMLTFNPLEFGDEGDYFCTAMSTNGDPARSENATLTSKAEMNSVPY